MKAIVYVEKKIFDENIELLPVFNSYEELEVISLTGPRSTYMSSDRPCLYILDRSTYRKDFLNHPENQHCIIGLLKEENLGFFTESNENVYILDSIQDAQSLIELLKIKYEHFLQYKAEFIDNHYCDLKIVSRSQDQKAISEFEQELYRRESDESLISDLKGIFKSVLDLDVEVEKIGETYLDKALKYVYLNDVELNLRYVLCFNEDKQEQVQVVLPTLNRYFMSRFNVESSTFLADWESVFNLFPIPMILCSEKGELILHSREYLKLNTSLVESTAFVDQEKVNLQGDFYQISVRSVEVGNTLITFIPLSAPNDEITNSSDSSELGIITSSIAHELNNPLAGALAAVDVLSLDDHEGEKGEGLKEIRKSLMRCKGIVETFLGFSRKEDSSSSGLKQYIVKESLDRALDLIRFRLIENNFKLDINYKKEAIFFPKINEHVFCMIIYILFNDLLTEVSHYNLISTAEQIEKVSFNVVESYDSVEFIIQGGSYSMRSDFAATKLLKHLLELEKISLTVNKSSLKIS